MDGNQQVDLILVQFNLMPDPLLLLQALELLLLLLQRATVAMGFAFCSTRSRLEVTKESTPSHDSLRVAEGFAHRLAG